MKLPLVRRTPAFQRDPAFVEADKWFQDLELLEDTCYDDAFDYAKSRYENTLAMLSNLDGKAESLFRFALVLTGALAAGSSQFPNALGNEVVVKLSLCAFAAGTLLSLWAKRPADLPRPFSPREYLENIHLTQDEQISKGVLAASMHVAAEGLVRIVNRKGTLVAWSTFALAAGVLVLLPLIA